MSDQNTNCDNENIIRQLLKVQAQVTVTPLVKHGTPKVHCINSCITPNSDYCEHESFDCDSCHCDCRDCCDLDPDCGTTWEYGRSNQKCNFTLTQVICVEIPISFDADVKIDEGIVCCDRPGFKSENIENRKKSNQFYMQMI